jgi:hypothetical protein
MCRFVDGNYTDNPALAGRKFKLLLMPRNTYKTSLVTIGDTIRTLVKDPNKRILLGNELFDNAKKFLGEIKGHFERNEKLRSAYGDLVGTDWTKEEITLKTKTSNKKEPSITASGIGVVKVGMHYDKIILDDLHSQANTGSMDMINQVIDYYKLCLSLLDPNGEMIIIGTRWHFFDLYAHIIEHEKHRFDYFVRRAVLDNGDLLFPEVLNRQFLENIRLSQGSYIYAGQYMNDPTDDENAKFRKEDIRYFKIDDEGLYRPAETPMQTTGYKTKWYNAHQMNWYLHLDPAKDRRESDMNGLVVSSVDPQDRVFVHYAQGFNGRPSEIIEKMISLIRHYRYVRNVIIETRGFQEMLADEFYKAVKKEKIYVQILEVLNSLQSKNARILGLQPRFERADIYLAKGLTELEDELLKLGVTRYDDLADALSFGLQHWNAPKVYGQPELEGGDRYGTLDWYRQLIEDKKSDIDSYKNTIGNTIALREYINA